MFYQFWMNWSSEEVRTRHCMLSEFWQDSQAALIGSAKTSFLISNQVIWIFPDSIENQQL